MAATGRIARMVGVEGRREGPGCSTRGRAGQAGRKERGTGREGKGRDGTPCGSFARCYIEDHIDPDAPDEPLYGRYTCREGRQGKRAAISHLDRDEHRVVVYSLSTHMFIIH